MVDIFNPRIDGGPIGGENGTEYFFRVRYRAQFDDAEQNDTFKWERDNNIFDTDDDQLTSTALTGNTFIANPLTMDRTFAVILPREVADTESGHEQIYARIYLRSSNNPGGADLPSTAEPADAATSSADRCVFTPHGDFNP